MNKLLNQEVFLTFSFLFLLATLGHFADRNDSFSYLFIYPKPEKSVLFWAEPTRIGHNKENPRDNTMLQPLLTPFKL